MGREFRKVDGSKRGLKEQKAPKKRPRTHQGKKTTSRTGPPTQKLEKSQKRKKPGGKSVKFNTGRLCKSSYHKPLGGAREEQGPAN